MYIITKNKGAGDIERIGNVLKSLHYDRQEEFRTKREGTRTGNEPLEKTNPQHRTSILRGRAIETMRSVAQSAIDGLGGKGKVFSSKEELSELGKRALKKDSAMI